MSFYYPGLRRLSGWEDMEDDYRDWYPEKGKEREEELTEEEKLEKKIEYLKTKDFCGADSIRECRRAEDKLKSLQRKKKYDAWFDSRNDDLKRLFHRIQYAFLMNNQDSVEIFVLLCDPDKADDSFCIRTLEEKDFLYELLRNYNYNVTICKTKETENFSKYRFDIELGKE